MTMKTKRVVIETREEDEDSNESLTEEESNNEEAALSYEDDSENEQGSSSEHEDVANTGWADSIAKILQTSKPKGKKSVVLSKAKKISDVKKAKLKDAGFEVEAEDGQVKRENVEESDDDDDADKPLRKKRKDLPIFRVKPNVLNKDRERLLSKIATKGVVQLFNAVKKQQKDIDSKLKDAGSLEVKRDKVLKSIDKREFLNVLMGGKGSETNDLKKESRPVTKVEANDNGPTWKVLRDDFMMSAKMKDWDKEIEDEDVDMKEESSDST